MSAATAARTAPQTGDLARLLDTEARLDARLDESRREAARLIEEARADAAAATARAADELREALARLDAALALEREAKLARFTAAATSDAARFDDVSDPRIAELAALVVARLLAGDDDR